MTDNVINQRRQYPRDSRRDGKTLTLGGCNEIQNKRYASNDI